VGTSALVVVTTPGGAGGSTPVGDGVGSDLFGRVVLLTPGAGVGASVAPLVMFISMHCVVVVTVVISGQRL
jgi:hypothetical protein